MRHLTLARTDITVSRLSFGTASLHHLSTGARRQDLLEAAFTYGFTHFDTAPYYGFGIAERELKPFLRRHRAAVTVTTKVGLYSPGSAAPTLAAVWARKILGKIAPRVSNPVIDWQLGAAAKSLDDSRRRLGTECIDLLLLHEPDHTAMHSDEFLRWLDELRRGGAIRAWGLGGEPAHLAPWLENDHGLSMVLQTRDSNDGKEANVIRGHGRDPQITYGYLSSARGKLDARTAADLVSGALRRNVNGSILVSTRKIARLMVLTATAETCDAVVN